MDLDLGKYTTTQDLFLSKVGINNSYLEDKQNLVEPFFVLFKFGSYFLGKRWSAVRVYQKKPVVLRVHN